MKDKKQGENHDSLPLYELSAECSEAAQALTEFDADEQTLADTLEDARKNILSFAI